MRICVFGAGAVGGHLAVRLAQTGNDVSVVARGEHLAAIRERGLTLKSGDRETTASLRAESEAAMLGRQDVVLVTLKTTSLGGVASAMAPLIGPATTVVFAQNGIPWWYNHCAAHTGTDAPDLSWMDPGSELTTLVAHTIGGVIYSANEVIEPGMVRNNSPDSNRLIVGEPSDRQSERVCDLRRTLEFAGFGSPETDAIRSWVWKKLVLNLSSSLLAAATGIPTAALRQIPALEAIFQRLHAEAATIAAAYCPGLSVTGPLQPRAGHTPSMLQDYERRRPMEIDALVVAPLAFARSAGITTPSLDVVAALVADRAQRAGLHCPSRALPI
jgi:2-dehydropantoate 2-reductase